MKDPLLVDNILSKEDYDRLLLALDNPKSFGFDPGFSRYCVGDGGLPILTELANKLVPVARQVFDSEGLLPTYALFAHYEGQILLQVYTSTKTIMPAHTLLICVFIR